VSKTADAQSKKIGVFGSLARFVRQIIAELRKVVRPTRQELITYASVVLVFVVIVMAFIGVVDVLISWLVNWAFGG
jgi:preprotein translocase subunit SecE